MKPNSRQPAKRQSRKKKAPLVTTRQSRKKKANVVTTQAAVARRLKVSRSTVHDWMIKGAPGKEGAYDVGAIEAWHKAYVAAGEQDPLFSGASSPALERYRAARANLAELEFLQRDGELRDREEVLEMLSRFFGHITAAKRRIGTGVDPIKAIDAALDNCERVLDELRNSGHK